MPLQALVFTALIAALGFPGAVPAQESRTATVGILRLSGQRDTTLTVADFARLPRSEIRVAAPHRHGSEAPPASPTVYSGVALVDVLALVGAPRDGALRGRAVASYLLIEAADGYRVVFSLDELAPEGSTTPVLLADRRDGQSLSGDEGPWRVIAPSARHSRWIRQVARLAIREAAP